MCTSARRGPPPLAGPMRSQAPHGRRRMAQTREAAWAAGRPIDFAQSTLVTTIETMRPRRHTPPRPHPRSPVATYLPVAAAQRRAIEPASEDEPILLTDLAADT